MQCMCPRPVSARAAIALSRMPAGDVARADTSHGDVCILGPCPHGPLLHWSKSLSDGWLVRARATEGGLQMYLRPVSARAAVVHQSGLSIRYTASTGSSTRLVDSRRGM